MSASWTIDVKSAHGNFQVEVSEGAGALVQDLAEAIKKKQNIQHDEFRLHFAGKSMELGDRTLQDYVRSTNTWK